MKRILLLLLISLTIRGLAQTTIPQKESGSKFSIKCENLYFEIDSADGARITSFKLDDKQLLSVGSSNDTQIGSTFWPSPQSVWSWPPLTALDSEPYASYISGSKITFKGSTDSKTQLRFYKTMYASAVDTSIVIEYTMKNEKSSAQSWAPWEITRVVGKGLSVFAQGDGSVTGILAPSTEELNGYVWYDQDNNIVDKSGTYKFICDGKGWLAHATDGMLFIKQFEDIEQSEAAKDEAEVEVYTAYDNTYTELENQGAYVSIPSKDSTTWTVKWFARTLPTSVDVSVGSTSLIAYIESVLSRSTGTVGSNNVPLACSVKVFPNPASKYMVVETNLESYRNTSLDVYDLQGRMVMKKTVNQNYQQLDISNLIGGNYIYVLSQNAISLTRGQISVKR
jgi:hypothetical protein